MTAVAVDHDVPMMSARHPVARGRLAMLATARRAYLGLAATGFAPVLEAAPIQAVRRRWQTPMDARDVLEIVGALSRADVRWWLAGGWGVDALAGRQTRRHKDLDLVVERSELEPAQAALRRIGFRPVPDTDPGAVHVADALMPDRRLVQDPAGRTVDLHPVDSATWPERVAIDQPFATGVVGGEIVGCLSLACQLAAHDGFELSAEHQANLRSMRRLASEGAS
jgi:lincosamide nucleotidyltransferase A/C/D/E